MSSGRRGMAILGAMYDKITCSECHLKFTVAMAIKLYDNIGTETKNPKEAKRFECPHCHKITPK